jgi:hypothetical protein
MLGSSTGDTQRGFDGGRIAGEPESKALPRANRAFMGARLGMLHCFGSNAESVLRASHVKESNHLRERAAEMRASSKELKDNNNTAIIMRFADLYDRLADLPRPEAIAQCSRTKSAVEAQFISPLLPFRAGI